MIQLIILIAGFLAITAIPCLGTPTCRMRIYTSKDDKTATKALNRSAWLLLIFSLFPAVIGMVAFTIATQNGAAAVLETPDFAFTYIVIGKPVAMMTKEDKIEAVRYLDQKGAFLIKKSVDRASEFYGISKFTLYNYLDAGREDAKETPKDDLQD